MPVTTNGPGNVATTSPPKQAEAPTKPAAPASVPREDDATAGARPGVSVGALKLTTRECVLAVFTLIVWLHLFAGGMLIDTQPYRCAISWSGVAEPSAQPDKPHPCSVYWTWDAEGKKSTYNKLLFGGGTEAGRSLFVEPLARWALTLLFFLPLNLAFISAAAGAIGSLGNIANLTNDATADGEFPRDRTNPFISGLLRGLFVYLLLISGMLLFDDAPFSQPAPGQYIRLAGFLSLFSFIINYNPNLFGSMLDLARYRIDRGKAGSVEYTPRTEKVKVNEPRRDVEITIDEDESKARVEFADETGGAGSQQDAQAQGTARSGEFDAANGNGHKSRDE